MKSARLIVPAPPAIPRDTEDLVGAANEKQVAIIGTPDDARAQVQRLADQSGRCHVVCTGFSVPRKMDNPN